MPDQVARGGRPRAIDVSSLADDAHQKGAVHMATCYVCCFALCYAGLTVFKDCDFYFNWCRVVDLW